MNRFIVPFKDDMNIQIRLTVLGFRSGILQLIYFCKERLNIAVCFQNASHQLMTNHIATAKVDNINTFNIFQQTD
jgi:hypothetical protein